MPIWLYLPPKLVLTEISNSHYSEPCEHVHGALYCEGKSREGFSEDITECCGNVWAVHCICTCQNSSTWSFGRIGAYSPCCRRV